MIRNITFFTYLLVAISISSCSSDNTTENNKTITVLESYKKITTENNNILISEITFEYNKNGNVIKHHTVDYFKKKGYEKLFYLNKSETNYTYNTSNKLLHLIEKDSLGKIKEDDALVYNDKGILTKVLSNKYSNSNYEYKTNSNNQIYYVYPIASENKSNIEYLYDTKGNVTSVKLEGSTLPREEFTYDEAYNPFKDMPLNLSVLEYRTAFSPIRYNYTPSNNIKTYKGVFYPIETKEYQYNKDNYPTYTKKINHNEYITEEFFNYKALTVEK